MPHPAATDLIIALTEERLAVRGFVALLQQEQQLLTENDLEQLLTLVEKKSEFVIRLNALTEARRLLLTRQLPSNDLTTIQNWFAANCPEGLTIWQEVRDLAEQAKQLNHINGELIQMKLRHNQQTLTALTRAVSNANLYGPDGQTSFTPGSGRSLGNG